MAMRNTILIRCFLRCVFSVCLGGFIHGCSSMPSLPLPSSSPPQEETVIQPSDTSALYQDAQQLFDMGQFEEAIALWEQIPSTDPKYMDAQLAINNARVEMERIAEETASYQDVSEFDSYIEQAEYLEQQGNIQEALKFYEEARQLEPQNILLHKKIEELYEILDDAVERHKALGEMYTSRGEYAKAKAEWERLLELEPSSTLAKQRLEDLEVLTATSDRVFVKRGRSLMQKGLLNEAKTEFEKALRIDAANERTLSYLVTLDDIAFTEYTIKEGDTLSSIAAQYTHKASDYLILADFNQLGKDAQLRIGQSINIPLILGFREALAPDAKAILKETSDMEETSSADSREITPVQEADAINDLQMIFEQAVTAYNQRSYREAIRLFNQVYEQDPENVEAYNYIFQAITSLQQRTSDAAGIFEEDISFQENLSASEVEALLKTAEAYREAGNLKEAITVLEQAEQVNPGNQEISQQLEEVRNDFKEVITAYLNEGIKLFNQEALEEAIVEWDKVLELEPDNKQAANYKAQAEKRLNALIKTSD